LGSGSDFEAITGAVSERLRQARLAQDGVGGVAAGDADRDRKIPFGGRAVPGLVAAFALPDESAAGSASRSAVIWT